MSTTVLTIRQLAELIHDMDPDGTVRIYDPDTIEDGITYTRTIQAIQQGWTTKAHDKNTRADILSIDLAP